VDGDEVNWDLCDGLNDLHQEDQEKVREAIERGYIVDEDWRGVCSPSIHRLLSSRTGLIIMTGCCWQPSGSS